MLFKHFLSFSIVIYSLSIQASEVMDRCFVAKENGQFVRQEGNCKKRHSPFSTFKIAIALMGFDSSILNTPQKPLIEFTPKIKKQFAPWYNPQKYPAMLYSARAQTPKTWMKYSVIWYSQYVTQKLGIEKFQYYLNILDYGNKDVSGTLQRNDGILSSWLDSSLQISPLEQVAFLEKLSNRNLSISKQAQEKTIAIMKLENIGDDWKLYGKTGGGIKSGWFVGWVEKGHRRIVFAQYTTQQENALISCGKISKEIVKDNLISIMGLE